MTVLSDARALAEGITDLRHRLHQEPEIGLQLPRTQEKVLDAFSGLPYEITLGTDTTSVTAVLRGTGAGASALRPVVLLRGDMDALSLQERTGVAFSSRPLSGSEDFSRVLQQVPGTFVFLSAVSRKADAATAAFNHSPLPPSTTMSWPTEPPCTPSWRCRGWPSWPPSDAL